MIKSPWTSWWQEDLPCEFDRNETKNNNQYLIELLGENWLKKRVERENKSHPLLKQWMNNGANSFIELNALAEDIQLIEKKPDFVTILNDLKSTNTCAATRHVIRCAAMFERGEKDIVSRFHPQTSHTSPDFSLHIGGKDYSVECKLLVVSESEILFGKYSDNLMNQIESSILTDKLIYPNISIVIKSYESLPEISSVIDSLKKGINKLQGKPLKGSFEKYNIFIHPLNVTQKVFSSHKSVNIFCPRSIKENIRVEGRIKSASGQLKKYDSEMSGLVCIGIGKHQDPYYIRDRLVNRFKNSQLGSISDVMLLRSGTFMEKPKRSTLDLISIISNENAKKSMPTKDLKLCPRGLYGPLVDDSRTLNEVSAYRKMIAEGQVEQPGAELFIPDIQYLTKEMLE